MIDALSCHAQYETGTRNPRRAPYTTHNFTLALSPDRMQKLMEALRPDMEMFGYTYSN